MKHGVDIFKKTKQNFYVFAPKQSYRGRQKLSLENVQHGRPYYTFRSNLSMCVQYYYSKHVRGRRSVVVVQSLENSYV